MAIGASDRKINPAGNITSAGRRVRKEPVLVPGVRITVLMSIPDARSPGDERDLERDYWLIDTDRLLPKTSAVVRAPCAGCD